MDIILMIISFVLLFLGIVGAVLPVLPGLVFSYGGLLIYKFGTDNNLWIGYIWIFGVLLIISTVLNYVLPAGLNRKYGGSRWGSIGSFLGMLVGIFFIPIPFGFLIGMLAGVFIAEWLRSTKEPKKAARAMKGAMIGFIISTGANLTLAIAMLLVVGLNLLNH